MNAPLDPNNILDAFEFLARWLCRQRVHAHVIVGGSCSMVLQTQAVRVAANDLDVSFRAGTQEGRRLDWFHRRDVFDEFRNTVTCMQPFRSLANLKVDPKFYSLDILGNNDVNPLDAVPYASYRNAAGQGATISLVTLNQIFDDKVHAADIGYYAKSLNQPRLASREVEKLQPNLTDAVALGALLERDVFSVRSGRGAYLPRKALDEISPETIADAEARGRAGRRGFVYHRVTL